MVFYLRDVVSQYTYEGRYIILSLISVNINFLLY